MVNHPSRVLSLKRWGIVLFFPSIIKTILRTVFSCFGNESSKFPKQRAHPGFGKSLRSFPKQPTIRVLSKNCSNHCFYFVWLPFSFRYYQRCTDDLISTGPSYREKQDLKSFCSLIIPGFKYIFCLWKPWKSQLIKLPNMKIFIVKYGNWWFYRQIW